MGRAKFSRADYLGAALAIVAEHGPAAVTVASVGARLGAPTGSFYHRFASRDVLLGTMWLETVHEFRQGLRATLAANDGLACALHTPAFARDRPDAARVLLLHHRDDFVHGEWPEDLRHGVATMAEQMLAERDDFARKIFGRTGAEEARLAQFLLAEVPLAAIRQHLLRGEAPGALVDRLIRITYRAVVADYHRRKRAEPQ